jgi:hypothetical protein
LLHHRVIVAAFNISRMRFAARFTTSLHGCRYHAGPLSVRLQATKILQCVTLTKLLLRASLPLNELPSGRRFPWSSYKRLSFVHWVVWYSPLCSLSCFMLTPLFFELFYAHPLLGCSCLMLNRECHHPYFAWGGVFVDCLLFIFTMYLTLFVAQHALLYTPISHGRERLSIR